MRMAGKQYTRAVALVLAVGAAPWGCDSPTSGAPGPSTTVGTHMPEAPPIGPVILSEAWFPAPLEVDPMPEHAPAAPWECKPGSYLVENGSFEVETGSCQYGLFVQPLLVPLRAGQRLHMVAWHLQLANETPAQGHMAVFIGQEKIFEVTPQIPGPAAAYDMELTLTADHPAGEPVVLHLHNHGYNNWNLLSLESTGAMP